MKNSDPEKLDTSNQPVFDQFIELTSYSYATDPELHILRNGLDEFGIEFYEKDAQTVATDPLLSNAIGGLKIMVLQSKEAEAFDVLIKIRRQLGTESTSTDHGNAAIKGLLMLILVIILVLLFTAFG